MRRVLLGGLGLALGVLARPALAQDFPTTRAARLGAPIAVPETNPDITPAGLLDRKPLFGSPTATPPVTVNQPPAPGTSPMPLPVPRTLNTGPNVSEIRGPMTTGVPTTVVPPPGAIPGVTMGDPIITNIGEPFEVTPAPAAGVPALQRLNACRNPRWYASAEYLLWWTRSTQLPTLITTSLPASNGILGAPDTIPVQEGSFGQTLHGGARFGGGWWFTDDQVRGIDWRFMFLFRNGNDFTANTTEYPVLARPFFNVNTPFGPFAEVVGSPGLAAGAVTTHLDNSLWGAEINYRRYLRGNACARLDALAGFRYMNFTENLSITESFIRTPDSPMTIGTPAIAGIVNDSFRAVNNFYGGQIGLTGEVRRGRWFVNGRGTIAFGTVHQTATIGGGQALAYPDGTIGVYQGGLLALPGANIGTFSQNKFAVMPEIGLNLGYHITPHLRAFVGYNFLYLSNVLRASGTIDQNVDAARIPNFPVAGIGAPISPAYPAPTFRTTDFWAQGINFGLQWTW
jgi:hypothetical protein